MTIGVLLARQRAGTGALGSVLDQHRGIRYLGEVFHHDAMDGPPNYFWFLRQLISAEPDMVLPNSNRARFERYAEFLQSHAQRKHAIIDIKYSSLHHFNAHWLGPLEPASLFKLLAEKKIPVIHLRRRNHLKSYISGKLAELNREWHAKSEDALKTRSLRVDASACLGFIEAQAREVLAVNRALKGYPRSIELEYSEIFDSEGLLRLSVADRLSRFLSVEPIEKRKPAFVKQTPDQLRRVIENYEEIAEALSSTPHWWMLTEQ